jgi:hypothetical protein
MSKQMDAGVELLTELVKERLQDLRREMQQKVELAIKLAACSLSQELMVAAESHHNQNGHAKNELVAARR